MATITAEEEYKRNPRLNPKDIEILREWSKKQPHLPAITDELLILFLNCSEFSLEKSKVVLDKYFTIRSHAQDVFSNRNPLEEGIQNALKIVDIAIMPKRDKNGNLIIIGRFKTNDSSSFVYKEYLRTEIIVLDYLVKKYGAVPGLVTVVDVKNFTMGHAMRINTGLMKKLTTYVQEGFPCVLREQHMINTGAAFTSFMNIAKPMLMKEFLERMYVHGSSMELLYEHIPKELLPKDYGGDLESIDYYSEQIKQEIESYGPLFLAEEASLLVDESKRPGKAKNAGDVFGLEGSFKQLEID